MFVRLFRLAVAAVLVAVVLVPWLGPAAAQTLYEVHGVSGRDVLNVRRNPSPQAEIVGALGPQASGIAVMQRDGDWAQVRINERLMGWVNTRFLRRASDSAAMPAQLQCSGTEPFWGLSLDGRAATFEMAQDETAREQSRITRRVTSRNNHTVTALTFGQGGRDRAIVQHSRICSDGMSDEIHDFEITVMRRDGSLLSGCCRPR